MSKGKFIKNSLSGTAADTVCLKLVKTVAKRGRDELTSAFRQTYLFLVKGGLDEPSGKTNRPPKITPFRIITIIKTH